MKNLYVSDIQKLEPGMNVEIFGWIRAKRAHRGLLFLDVEDSTGSLQVVLRQETSTVGFAQADNLALEASVRVSGVVRQSLKKPQVEIEADEIELIGDVSLNISPRPRTRFDIFAEKFADSSLKKRHLYLRNEKLMAVLRMRHDLFGIMHHWFREQGFIEIHGPLLAQVPLYEDKTAFSLDFFGHPVFLNQCIAFYLESAVHAFEKVYNIGPSFRAEESRSRRHLAEYWHVKAEIAFTDYEDIIQFTEHLLSHIVREVSIECAPELKILGATIDVEHFAAIPYPRVTYHEAFEMLKRAGLNPEWDESLGANEMKSLSRQFNTPFWITGLPRAIEPFPYMLDPADSSKTKTADLIAPEGYGELLGVAEKIYQPEPLLERMKEKGRESDKRYEWYYDLRRFGSVPHSGVGMGVERLLRWLLKLNHVRDTIPFPRLFDRSPYP